MGKDRRVKRSGVKNTIIDYLILKAQAVVSSGEMDWDQFFYSKYRLFWSNTLKIGTPVRFLPTDKDIRKFSSISGERVKKTVGMSSHEFDPLMAIVTKRIRR